MDPVAITWNTGKKTGTAIRKLNGGNLAPYIANEMAGLNIRKSFRELNLAFARLHDAPLTNAGCRLVDISHIFPLFHLDENDPRNYDFGYTDDYIRNCIECGTQVYYRLGPSIEHSINKYFIGKPADVNKWINICDHIIRHYTEGWANGFCYDIAYWEIWNEPDLDPDDSDNKRTWGGTKAQFFDLYEIAAKHLKSCFPALKIGGPALASDWDWGKEFLFEMKKRGVPIDFFSWHCYTSDVAKFKMFVEHWRKTLDDAGYPDAESILNEWNYVSGWTDEKWITSIETMKNHKGAAFIAGAMEVCQNAGLDMLMYYDARPGAMNGLFNTDLVCNRLKGYYPFYMFNQLYRLKNAVEVKCHSEDLFGCAARDGADSAVLFTYYNDEEKADEEIEIEIIRPQAGSAELEFYVSDKENDCNLFKKETVFSQTHSSFVTLKMYSTVLLTIKEREE